jgi:hypothetical protein
MVTNLRASSRHLLEAIYRAPGAVETRTEDMRHGLDSHRTNGRHFLAEQLPALLATTAYVLQKELRMRAAGTAFGRARVSILRDRLLRRGA